MHRIGRGRRVVPSAVAVAVVVAVCLCGAQAGSARPGIARAFAVCPPTSLPLFSPGLKRLPVRAVIEREGVTCAHAHRVIGTYLRRLISRTCTDSRCVLPAGGGWTCHFVPDRGIGSSGRADAACSRSSTVRFKVVPSDLQVTTAAGVICEMSATAVSCEGESPPRNDIARLAADGTVRVCRSTVSAVAGGCQTFDTVQATPTYFAGRGLTIGPFRCAIVPAGVRCVVTASGKGFEMTATDVTAIGGATLLPAST